MKTMKTIRRDRRTFGLFSLIVGTVTVFAMLAAAVVTANALINAHLTDGMEWELPPSHGASSGPVLDPNEEILPTPPGRRNVLVLGVDNFNLADVVLIASIDVQHGAVRILNIPRDTFTELPPSRVESMRALGLRPPGSGQMKINELRAWGREYGALFAQEQLSEMLGIELHYFVEIHLGGFRELVDLVGGVEIEVPFRLRYHAPDQNLFIDIAPGLQHLNGIQAEHLVRYRSSYRDADLGRVAVQQQFMIQLFRQVLQRETVMNNLVGLATIAMEHVRTDLRLTDIPEYVPFAVALQPENIVAHMLPGTDGRISGRSYFIPDPARMADTIYAVFHDIAPPQTFQPLPVGSPSLAARIAVLNGTNVSGAAMNIADRLRPLNVPVVHIGHYTGQRRNNTQIRVRAEGMGEDLLPFFHENATIHVDPQMDAAFDIIIVVGRFEL